jgi:ubiquinone/menaquinone biosynthesis C-methylase UbiE
MDFDKVSRDYDEIHNRSIKLFGEKTDYFTLYKLRLINNFYNKREINREIKILDLGCGIGKLERYILRFFKKARVFGIDVSKKSIELAKSSLKNDNLSFFIYDGKRIPFKDSYFDAVILSCVLHHIKPRERDSILKELKRVVKKEGFLFIFEHNPLNPLTRYVVKNCEFDKDAELISKKDCLSLLKKNDFFIEESAYIVFFPRILSFLRSIESKLAFLPMGAQYFISAKNH